MYLPIAILPCEFATPPPWLIPALRPDTTLLQFPKTNTPASVIQTEFHTLQAAFSDSTFLYTDASKSVKASSVQPSLGLPYADYYGYHLQLVCSRANSTLSSKPATLSPR
ncbi:hypothetical protein Zmor_001144 [Zophobas morio]|uniref:Uncharacterized protein n=1 Tax=Zophobas morio TaxID=2755281 RepID=A0AA38IXZ6_9CUCU|nr:hypothetical protein Zmor_001144 [Zophobas morio]